MSKKHFHYGARFQESMISMMLRDVSFAHKCIEYVPSEYLHSDAHRWIFEQIAKTYEESSSIPSMIEIEESLKMIDKVKRRPISKVVDRCFGQDPESPTFIRAQLEDFSKRTNFAELFAYGQVLYNEGNTGEAYSYVLEAINHLHAINFNDEETIDISKFEEYRQRFISQKATIHGGDIPTGIGELDDVLGGGLSKAEGEFGCILAEPKMGKSVGLVHMGFNGMAHNFKVAHFILEGTTEQTMMRYQSRATGIPYNNIKLDDLTPKQRVKLQEIGEIYSGNIELVPCNKHWEYSTGDIQNKLKEFERRGWSPDLIVVDYADLLHARGDNYQRQDLEQRDVFRDLKAISMGRKVALWTASQSQRPQKSEQNKKRTLTGSSVSESYEKIRVIDFLGTLNQTPREKKLGLLRFHCDIYRSNTSNRTINLITSFDRMIFHKSIWGTVNNKYMPKGRSR